MKKINLVVLIIFIIFNALKTVKATIVSDSENDFFPWAKSEGFMDISQVETTLQNDNVIIKSTFYNPINSYIPRGMFHMDLDSDINTGALLKYIDLNPEGWEDKVNPIGAEYVLDFSGYQPFKKARLFATNGIIIDCDIRTTIESGEWTDFGLVDILMDQYYFSISIPNSVLNDDGEMDFTLIAAAAFYPKLNPQDVAQKTSNPVPEPASIFLFVFGLIEVCVFKEKK